MNDLDHNQSAEKLRHAQEQLAYWQGILSNLDARVAELEASSAAGEREYHEAAVNALTNYDDAAREHLAELARRARERDDMRNSLPQARPRILREIELAKRRLGFAEAFAEAGDRITGFSELMQLAAQFDAFAPQVATLSTEFEAMAQKLRGRGVEVPGNTGAYIPPARPAADLVREKWDQFERTYVKAKARLEEFEANPLTDAEISQRLRAGYAAELEAEKLKKAAEARRKEEEERAARKREDEERAEWRCKNAVTYRLGDPRNPAIIDLTPRPIEHHPEHTRKG